MEKDHHTFSFDALGTRLDLRVESSSFSEEDFLRLQAWILSFEETYSRFRSGNLLEKINREGHGILPQEGREMLDFALKLARKTNGYFDPTIAPILEENGYGMGSRSAASQGYEYVVLQDDYVVLHDNVRLEFGGVGKGYALDRIATMLSRHPRYLLNFWGDIFAQGVWKISVQHPQQKNMSIGEIELHNSSLCASSGFERKIDDFHHLVDPFTKKPAREVMASFVESASGMKADAYATALCVLPLAESVRLLGEGEVEGAIIAHDGKIYQSRSSKIRFFLS